MPKNLLKAFFADDDDDERRPAPADAAGAPAPDAPAEAGVTPRSLADAWDRIADQGQRVEARLDAVEKAQRELLEATRALQDVARQQLDVLKFLGRFAEAGERRGRELQAQFSGVPDVLRTLPSATKEQAERLSEIAARLYEKAQDNTVNAIRSAQATHQRTVEDLIDRSLGAMRRATYVAAFTAAAAVIVAVAMWLRGAPQ
jgi:hypothetical protein